MIRYIVLAILFLLFSCDSAIHYDYSENGKASVTIDSIEYLGSAHLTSIKQGDLIIKSIDLSFDDSTKIEISSYRFEVRNYYFSPTQGVRFTLTYNGKPFYLAKDGTLSIKYVGSGHVIGEFDIVVYDATSSYSDCPDDMKQTNGRFNAIEL